MRSGSTLATGAALGAVTGQLAQTLGLASLVSFWGDRTVFPLVAALAGAGLAAAPPGWRPLRRAGLAVLAACAALWLAVLFTPLCAWLAAPLRREDRPRAADAVFVLSSLVQSDLEPSAAAMSRLLRGVQLVAAGHARLLVISELPAGYPRQEPWARALLASLGVDAELAVVEPVLRTRDEAVGIARLLRARGLRRVLLSTSPSHSRRSAESLEACGLEVISTPGIETRWDEPDFPVRADRQSAFGALAHEWVGLGYYRFRRWIGPNPAPC